MAQFGVVEVGIEAPDKVSERNSAWKKALGELKVGESRFVTGVNDKTLAAAVYRNQKAMRKEEPGITFKWAAGHNEQLEDGFRIWRVA